MDYQQKYLKYKTKYLNLKDSKMSIQHGGALTAAQRQKITDTRRAIPDGEFYLFGYGSNSPTQLTERLSGFDADSSIPIGNRVTGADIRNNIFAAKLDGYKRGFFGYSEGRRGSVATIYPGASASASAAAAAAATTLQVFGTALRMTKERTGTGPNPAKNFFVGGKRITFDDLLKTEGIQYEKYVLQPLGNVQIWDPIERRYVNARPAFAFVGNLDYQPPDRLRDLQGSQPSQGYLEAVAQNLMERRILKGERIDEPPIEIDIKIWRNGRWVNGDPDKVRFTTR